MMWALPKQQQENKERVNEGEHGRCVLYSHMKIEE
jgi:hypothetical protein